MIPTAEEERQKTATLKEADKWIKSRLLAGYSPDAIKNLVDKAVSDLLHEQRRLRQQMGTLEYHKRVLVDSLKTLQYSEAIGSGVVVIKVDLFGEVEKAYETVTEHQITKKDPK